ncbi:MAG: hypothetical protein CL454_00925 [Acidimicrobiaceae bacterium]|nr:hypothetical protein [Acidimicrobiaceae bacterium]
MSRKNKHVQNKSPVQWVPQLILDGYTPPPFAKKKHEPLKLPDIWFEGYQGYQSWDITTVYDFEFAHEFWQGVNWTPKVSELLSSSTAHRTVQAHPIGNVKSIFVFRSYEHTERKPTLIEMGAPGMMVAYRYEIPNLSAEQLNQEWEDVRLGAIGESINQQSWALQGVRLLDRTKNCQTNQKKVSHRFELWCSKEAEDVQNFAKKRAELLGGRFTKTTA